jgi:hypothetical protein
MSNWRKFENIVGANPVSRACALLSALTLALPWLVTKSYSVRSPAGGLVAVASPPEFYSILSMAAAFFDYGRFPNSGLIPIAALAFIVGTIIAWRSPIGGVIQAGSVGSIVGLTALVDYGLDDGITTVEVGFGIAMYLGFILAFATVLSLWPSGRSAIMVPFRAASSRVRLLVSRTN